MSDDVTIDLVDGAQAARMLGVKPSRIKQLVRDKLLVGFRRDGSWWVPAEVLVELDSTLGRDPAAEKLAERIAQSVRVAEGDDPLPPATHVPLWTLSGTVTVLADAGFSDKESLEWLFRRSEELDQRPIDALRNGRHHQVNTVASSLAW